MTLIYGEVVLISENVTMIEIEFTFVLVNSIFLKRFILVSNVYCVLKATCFEVKASNSPKEKKNRFIYKSTKNYKKTVQESTLINKHKI